MITAFIGVAGSGKDFRKAELVAKGAVGLDFKDTLVEMAEDLIGFPIGTGDDYDAFKVNIVGLTAPSLNNHGRMALHKITDDILRLAPDAMTGRKLLQRLGTEVMRKRYVDYWAHQFYKKAESLVQKGKDIACADCRFDNEMMTIQNLALFHNTPYKFIFCDFRSPRYKPDMPHESEKLAQEYLRRGYKDGDEIRERIWTATTPRSPTL